MEEWALIGVAGFVAAMVDGTLGMGFGPTSSTILLASGVSPVTAAVSVNIAKVVTGLLGGTAHWKAGNVDRTLFRDLALTGTAGAAAGAVILTAVDGDALRPWLAAGLLVVGLRLFVRFAFGRHESESDGGASPRRPAVWTAAAAGGVTNGMIGAWGPVVTPALLHQGVAPRLVVGSVNAAEVVVAVVSVGTLVGALGADGIDRAATLAMLVGGAAAAPLAARVVRRVPPRAMGVTMAVLLVVTQSRELVMSRDPAALTFVAVGAAAVAGLATVRRVRSGHGTDGSSWQPRIGVVDERSHLGR